MKKVGLVTIYTVPNFGSVLQAFATQVILENLGFECDIINYDRNNSWYYSHGSKKICLKSKVAYALGLKEHHRKAKKLEKFRNTFLHLTKKYSSLDELEAESWSDYHAVVVGSDQVWNTRFSYGDSVYLLSFVPDVTPKIAFASSFALKTLPDPYLGKFRKYLDRFAAISVRESHGKDIIMKQLYLAKNVEVVLDPTFLLSVDEWIKVIPRSKFVKKEKYILLYMLDYAFKPQPYIYEVAAFLQRKMGAKIYVLEGTIAKEYRSMLNVVDVLDSSIPEFIDYFYNADLVLTSSFHGTAFALNFGRPLVSIVPDDGDDRQTSILNQLELSSHAVKVGTNFSEIVYDYDVRAEQDRLGELRMKSLEWLRSTV